MKFTAKKVFNDRIIDIIALIIGILAVVFFCLAYFVIGTDSYVEFHDQLDGEVLNYIYQAKYLFSGNDMIPEFMNGMSKSSMAMPAPIGVIFYIFLPPFYAYAIMHLLVLFVGYIGTYALIKKLTQNPIISILISCVFIYLPFYSVYGLSILGQPMLMYSLWQIYDAKKIKLRYLFGVFLYAISSSLALIGFAMVGILSVAIMVLYVRKKNWTGLAVAWIVMVGTYAATNLNMLKNVLLSSDSQELIHREEMLITPISDVWDYVKEVFFEGVSYAFSYNMLIAILAAFIIGIYPIVKKGVFKKSLNGLYWWIVGLFFSNIIIVILATLWHIEPIVRIRNTVGGVVKTFQADRITWILPMCWYVVLALCVVLLIKEVKWMNAGYILAFVIIFAQGQVVYENSMIFHNLRLMIFPDTYILMDWNDYYAPDVYQQIDDFIGEDKSAYRTVSLGLPPAAALYNGFYCLDGYSNFYSLEYKHQFRKIIAKELEKEEEVKFYFDSWGNRCYMLNAETGNFMLIDKNNNGTYKNLEIDTHQLKEMGAKYIFSGMQIENATELNLKLARTEPFLTESSYYKIWLYEICE